MILVLLTTGCETKNTATAKIEQINQSGLSGLAVFTEYKNGIKLNLELAARGKKQVAVHIHEGSECDKESGATAGGHWNPTGEAHGFWGTVEFHSGDVGNITTNKNGYGKYVMIDTLARWSIGGEKKTNIINKTIIVHEGVDDGTTQPTGDAGTRIGCGPIVE